MRGLLAAALVVTACATACPVLAATKSVAVSVRVIVEPSAVITTGSGGVVVRTNGDAPLVVRIGPEEVEVIF